MTDPTHQLPVGGSYTLRTVTAGHQSTSTINDATLSLIIRTYAEAGYEPEVHEALKELDEKGEMTLVHTAGEIHVKVLLN